MLTSKFERNFPYIGLATLTLINENRPYESSVMFSFSFQSFKQSNSSINKFFRSIISDSTFTKTSVLVFLQNTTRKTSITLPNPTVHCHSLDTKKKKHKIVFRIWAEEFSCNKFHFQMQLGPHANCI